MTITIHNVLQGTDEWHSLRRGLITASELRLLMTPKLKVSDNDKSRSHIYELAAQRITQYTEPSFVSDSMLRGHDDEVRAKALYSEHYAPITEVGFVTNSRHGFTIGCSPDGFVGDDGMVEIKSRCQKYQVQTALEIADGAQLPEEFMLQVQGGLLITERKWCDFISYCGGMPMIVNRVEADSSIQERILDACRIAEAAICTVAGRFKMAAKERGWIATEREERELFV